MGGKNPPPSVRFRHKISGHSKVQPEEIASHRRFIALLLQNAGYKPDLFQVQTWIEVMASSRRRSVIEIGKTKAHSIHLAVQDTREAVRPEVRYNFWLIVPVSQLNADGQRPLPNLISEVKERLKAAIPETESEWTAYGRDALTGRKTRVVDRPDMAPEPAADQEAGTAVTSDVLEHAVCSLLENQLSKHHAGWVDFEQVMEILQIGFPSLDPKEVMILACKAPEQRKIEIHAVCGGKPHHIRLANPPTPYPAPVGQREREVLLAGWPHLQDKPQFVEWDKTNLPEGINQHIICANFINLAKKGVVRCEKDGRYNLWYRGQPKVICYARSNFVEEYVMLDLNHPEDEVVVRAEEGVSRLAEVKPETSKGAADAEDGGQNPGAEMPAEPAGGYETDEVIADDVEAGDEPAVEDVVALLETSLEKFRQRFEEHAAYAALLDRKQTLDQAIKRASLATAQAEDDPLLVDEIGLLRDRAAVLSQESAALADKTDPTRQEILAQALKEAGDQARIFAATIDRVFSGLETTERNPSSSS